MAFTLQSYSRAATQIDGETDNVGSVERPVSIAVDGDVFKTVSTIANGANAVIYNDELTTFNYMHISSDYDVRLKFTDSASNTFNMQLKGTENTNKYGIGFQLGKDETASNAVTLNAVQAFNTSGNTAKVKIFVVK